MPGPQPVDITGQRFGKLVAIGFEHKKCCQAYWRARCDCGNETVVRKSSLPFGKTKSCGCEQQSGIGVCSTSRGRSKPIDITGKRFGGIVVTAPGESIRGSRHWECLCDCGNAFTARGKDIKSGNTKSCGCGKPPPSTAGEFVGKQVGSLTIMYEAETHPCGQKNWVCLCDCGRWSERSTSVLRYTKRPRCECRSKKATGSKK